MRYIIPAFIFLLVTGCEDLSYKPRKGFTQGKGVPDVDGNFYSSVVIGKQEWMVQNLKTTHFNDGTVIPLVAPALDWAGLDSPGYCWYDNDAQNADPYGALYNYYAVNTDKLAPVGWHIPTASDWKALAEHLGTHQLGGNLKEKGYVHWIPPNEGATNSTGFTGLPAGYRDTSGEFRELGGFAFFWGSGSHISNPGMPFARILRNNDPYLHLAGQSSMQPGYSVRCIKD